MLIFVSFRQSPSQITCKITDHAADQKLSYQATHNNARILTISCAGEKDYTQEKCVIARARETVYSVVYMIR